MLILKLQDYLSKLSNIESEVVILKTVLIKIYKERSNELLGILLIVLATLLGVSLYFETTGIVGEFLTQIFKVIMGEGAYALPLPLLIWGIGTIRSDKIEITVRGIGFLLLCLVGLTLLHIKIGTGLELEAGLAGKGGGTIGAVILYVIRRSVGKIGIYIILSAIALVGFLLLTNLFLATIIRDFKERIVTFYENLKDKFDFRDFANKVRTKFKKAKSIKKDKSNKIKNKVSNNEKKTKKTVKDKKNKKAKNKRIQDKKTKNEDKNLNQSKSTREEKTKQKTKKKADKTPKNQEECAVTKEETEEDGYILPSLSILQEVDIVDSAELNQADAGLLEETLRSFGVDAEVVDVNYGPAITRYEIHPAPGVKVSKISNLSNDIALSLAASDVRIEAPVPGKAVVGIEVPNQQQVMVHIREILESDVFKNANSKLSIALGKDIAGRPIISDLSSMPHLLVAGATGSGKSVCINSIISSLLYKGTPDEIKMMLIDPKMVELSIYNNIPHLIAPVVTDAKKAATALKWVVEEMENRYELFASSGAKGINSYNRQLTDEDDAKKLPYIVVIIDELSDLMMVAANAVEDAICRLAQMARAAGIHLIIATQRPSVDVITGVIKANIPSRISFAVSSQADSRTILDSGGAEKLLGKGDMLFAPVGSQKTIRIQGSFISDKEVKDLVKYVKNQDNPEYAEKIAEIKEKEIKIETDDKDELYEDAVRLVVKKRASISMLQRRLRVGYTRAARLIDTMEEEGIVGEHRGSKPREVLITKEDLEGIFGDEEGKKL
jgi:S-DNA-T family DNA segregation ATPase FtsK/SpoIIIE